MIRERTIGQRRPPSGPNRNRDKCEAFCASLASKLDNLEQSLQPKLLSLAWVSLAIEFMRSTYSDMIHLVEELGESTSGDFKGSGDFWLEDYMTESMKLLDICNILKPAISQFEHYQMCVQLVLQVSQRAAEDHLAGTYTCTTSRNLSGAFQSSDEELQKLLDTAPAQTKSLIVLSERLVSGNVNSWTKGFNNVTRFTSVSIGDLKFSPEQVGCSTPAASIDPAKANGNGKKVDGLVIVMEATRDAIDFVSRMLVWVLTSSSKDFPRIVKWEHSWSPAFRLLQDKLFEQFGERSWEPRQTSILAFQEISLVQGCASDLKLKIGELVSKPADEHSVAGIQDLIQKLTEHVSELQGDGAFDVPRYCSSCQGGLERISSQVNHLFDDLVRTRKKLLDKAQRSSAIHRAYTL